MDDLISRQEALDVIFPYCPDDDGTCSKNGDDLRNLLDDIENLPSAQPQYEELTPEEAVSEIASGSIMSAWYWVDMVIRLKQMGYAICKKR